MRKLHKAKASSTRDDIILMLKTRAPLTVSDIAVDLGITEMAVRRHLNNLERDQLIQTELVRQPMGRPTHMYSLTEKADELFPKNYADLTLGFLQDLEELDGKEKVEQLFQLREARLVEEYKDKMKTLSLEEKIKALAELQNNKGYMASWEKVEEGHYLFKENNCPISQIAKEYHTACSSELSLFQELLVHAQVECNHSLAKDGEYCVYTIKEEDSRS